MGLLQDDAEWDSYLYEASELKTGQQLYYLFAIIFLFCQSLAPEVLWNNHKLSLCKDILYQYNQFINTESTNLNDSIESEVLDQLEQYLLLNEKSLKDFPNMSLSKERVIIND